MGLFGGKNTTTVTRANKISDFTVATAEYGAAVMEVIGTTRISGNVIYYDDFTAHEHKETQTQRTGKGGGSKSTSVNITYTYTVAVILGLCEGPISTIRRIWKNKEIYNYPNDNVGLTLYKGTANQQPWPYVVGKHPNRALAYQGLAYMCGVVDLGDSNSLPNYNFEVVGKLLYDGVDANPMDYIQYVLGKVGQANASIIGAENFRDYCYKADLLISTPMDATGPQEAQKIVNEIADLCGAYIFHSNNSYKIVCLEDRPVRGWAPDWTIKYDLTTDDFVPQNGSCIVWSRKDSSEQYNRFSVEYNNRDNSYAKETVTYEDTADIAENGVKQAPTIQAGYIYSKSRAIRIAECAARRSKVGRNQYQFKLGWAFCLLEPGDKVRITDEASGIVNQPVMIKEITEDQNGLLSVTAISWFDGEYGEAEYDVHEVDRPEIDFNVPPGNTAAPVIFQPPADLTQNGLEVWIAAKGVNSNSWGGCIVYVSDDNQYFRQAGQITNNARFGTLSANITASATSLEVAINGTMLSGTQQDAERANTLLWIDGECLSYQTAKLLQNGHYQLSGLIRGQYNTTPAAHSSGTMVVRCDTALLRAPFSKEDIGKLLYFKFCSYNIFGAMEQSLAEVTAYQYTLQSYYVPGVRNLTARNRYRQLKDGVHRYDIVVTWDPPNMQSYLEGRVWYKTSGLQVKDMTSAQVPVKQLGFSGEWIFGGSGQNTVTIPQAVVGDTYKIAVTTVDIWGVETSPDAAPYKEILVALKTEKPNTPDGFGITFGTASVLSWNEVCNTDIAFYEIRLDANPGLENVGLLARVTGLTTAVTLPSRTGRLYLYAYSASGKYSTPAFLDYNKPVPPKPSEPILTAKLGGFSLVTGEIPVGCNGMNIYINSYNDSVKVHTVNNTYTHMCDAGGYDVTVAYTDIFGEGTLSDERSVVIKAVVDAALLEAEAVTKAKLSAALQSSIDAAEQNILDTAALGTRVTTAEGTIVSQGLAITQNATDISSVAGRVTTAESTITTQGSSISQNADAISAVVTNLNDSTLARNYTAIQVMQDGIASKVSSSDLDNEVSSFLSQTATGFYIQGDLIHITGNTLIDNGVVTADMIQAGAITADAIYQAGYKVKNIIVLSGLISISKDASFFNNMAKVIPRPSEYTIDQCIFNAFGYSDTWGIVTPYVFQENGEYKVVPQDFKSKTGTIPNTVKIAYRTVGFK